MSHNGMASIKSIPQLNHYNEGSTQFLRYGIAFTNQCNLMRVAPSTSTATRSADSHKFLKTGGL